MRSILIIFASFLLQNIAFSQTLFLSAQCIISLNFDFLFEKEKFTINETTYHHFKNGDSILIETLRFYISNIEFLQDKKVVWQEQNSVHLIDAALSQTLKIATKCPPNLTFDQLQFNLGIDSTTNVSGALGGDLDPTKGMYWTWQSGYINFKIEGKNPRCNTRNHAFQFHLGGYNLLYNALQTIVLDIKKDKEVNIIFDISKFINDIDFVQKPNIMSPCKEAVLMSKKITKGFYLFD